MPQLRSETVFDVFVVGGGINGVGIAVDFAGRGLKVGLCEKGDLAGATSSSSSKLIHGGLRYLEHYEFRLVREALAEREVLLKMAPHIARPMRFCLPYRPHLRPAWMIRIGLFFYDHLSTRVSLQGSNGIRFGSNSPLRPEFTKGFEYSDAWVDDARLVVLNAMELKRQGGHVYTRTQATSAEREDGFWVISLTDAITGDTTTIKSRALVNAAGPWVNLFQETGLHKSSPRKIRLIKGSHIVVPRLHDEDRAYILQNTDHRIVFVIPWLQRYSLIGTTDIEFRGDPAKVSCSEEEKQYLCNIINQHFRYAITRDDIIWDYAGVRPLCEDESSLPQAITRDYTMELQDEDGQTPLLSIFGGKLTTYRKLGEAAVEKMAGYFPQISGSWTVDNILPGGEQVTSIEGFAHELQAKYPWLTPSMIQRYSESYGALTFRVLGSARCLEDLGQDFGAGLFTAEVDYLILNEWAYTLDDIIWRRSKLGMFLDKRQQATLADYMCERLPQLVPERFNQVDADFSQTG